MEARLHDASDGAAPVKAEQSVAPMLQTGCTWEGEARTSPHKETGKSATEGGEGPTEPAAQASASARDRLQLSLAGPPTSAAPLINIEVPSAPLPSEPRVITVHDRKLRVSSQDETISLYALCRRWMQNDPDAPAPLHQEMGKPETMRDPPDGVDNATILPLPGPVNTPKGSGPDELRAQLRARGLAVRAHFASKRTAKLAAYQRRIGKLLPDLE